MASCSDTRLIGRWCGLRETDQVGSASIRYHRPPPDEAFVTPHGEAHPLWRSLINMVLNPIFSFRGGVTKQWRSAFSDVWPALAHAYRASLSSTSHTVTRRPEPEFMSWPMPCTSAWSVSASRSNGSLRMMLAIEISLPDASRRGLLTGNIRLLSHSTPAPFCLRSWSSRKRCSELSKGAPQTDPSRYRTTGRELYPQSIGFRAWA